MMQMLSKNRFFIVSACIVILAAGIFCSGCTSTNTQSPAPGTSVAASQPAVTTTVPVTVSETPGITAPLASATTSALLTTVPPASSPVQVTLNSAQKKTQLGTYHPKAGNVFLVVDITIKNTDKTEDFEYSDSSFTLYDKPNQRKYSPITTQVSGSLTSPLTSGKVPIKSEKTGQIVFGVVDMGTAGYKFSVTNSTGTELASFVKFDVS